jgi:hypothetical protein
MAKIGDLEAFYGSNSPNLDYFFFGKGLAPGNGSFGLALEGFAFGDLAMMRISREKRWRCMRESNSPGGIDNPEY